MTTLVWALAAVALVLAAGRILLQWFAARQATQCHDLPPLLFVEPGSPLIQESPLPLPVTAAEGNGAGITSDPGSIRKRALRSKPVFELIAVERPAVATGGYSAGPVRNGAHPAHEVVEDGDLTMQLLPGRLEPVNGRPEQEIRFISMAGAHRFTLGRSPGPPQMHIQLSSPTASRMHEFMEYHDGRWEIGNLSRTNAVVVNGSPLQGNATRRLEPDDQVELGQLVFVFRSR